MLQSSSHFRLLICLLMASTGLLALAASRGAPRELLAGELFKASRYKEAAAVYREERAAAGKRGIRIIAIGLGSELGATVPVKTGIKLVVVEIPIIAIGGVTGLDDVLDFLAAGAVAVQEGKILKVGSADEIKKLAGPSTRLVDLGADKCIPCKMMAPILQELKKEYAGRMEVQFIDVWQNEDAGKKYGVEMIPTQIFFDANEKELFRHTGPWYTLETPSAP